MGTSTGESRGGGAAASYGDAKTTKQWLRRLQPKPATLLCDHAARSDPARDGRRPPRLEDRTERRIQSLQLFDPASAFPENRVPLCGPML